MSVIILVSSIQETPHGVSPSSPTPSKPFFSASLPLPPGLNRSYRTAQRKKADGTIHVVFFASPQLEQFKRDALHCLQDVQTTRCDWSLTNAIREASRCTRGKRVQHPPLALQMHFYFKSLWKRDVDGGVKAVQDAVFSHLELNDNLVVDLHICKRVDPGNPRVDVQVACLVGRETTW